MLRAASESSLSHKLGASLGRSFSLAQAPLRKLKFKALSLLVTVYYLQQNSEVSIRTWEKQLCSNYTFCRGMVCFICIIAKFMRLPTSGSGLFPATVITFPILLLLPSVFLSTLFCLFAFLNVVSFIHSHVQPSIPKSFFPFWFSLHALFLCWFFFFEGLKDFCLKQR